MKRLFAGLHVQENRPDITVTENQYGKPLLRFIRGKVGSDQDAEDLLQDVWYQLSKRDESEPTIESISGWLYKVAKNKITDGYRKKRPEVLEDFSFQSDDGTVDFKEILLSEADTPEDAWFKKVFWDELLAALQELPENQREVFEMNELEDLSLQEIADRQDEKLKTIISRKGYAIKHLRTRLNDLYQDLIRW